MERNGIRLQIKKEQVSDDVVESLDVSILQNKLLKPILGIYRNQEKTNELSLLEESAD